MCYSPCQMRQACEMGPVQGRYLLLKHLLRRLRLYHLSESLVDFSSHRLAVHALDAAYTLLHASVSVDDELELLHNAFELQVIPEALFGHPQLDAWRTSISMKMARRSTAARRGSVAHGDAVGAGE